MAAIVVRGLDESVKTALAAQARKHGRSMEAEVRAILTQAASKPNIGIALMHVAREAGGVDDLPVPNRDERARSVDFA